MSGKLVSKYSSIADMTSVLQTIEAQRNGLNLVTFTEMDSTLEPKIATGSVVEIAGALFQFDEDTAISGSAVGGDNYILLTPSGTGADQILSASYSSTLPAFDTEKNGYYSGLARAVGYVSLSGSSYLRKSVVKDGNGVFVGGSIKAKDDSFIDGSLTVSGNLKTSFLNMNGLFFVESSGAGFEAGVFVGGIGYDLDQVVLQAWRFFNGDWIGEPHYVFTKKNDSGLLKIVSTSLVDSVQYKVLVVVY